MNDSEAQTPSIPQRQKRRFISFLWKLAGITLVAGCLIALFIKGIQPPNARSGLPASHLNLRAIGVAMHNYASMHNDFLPPGASVNERSAALHSWVTHLLPMLDMPELFQKLDRQIPWDAPENAKVFSTEIAVFLNPFLDETKGMNGYALIHYSVNQNLLYENSSVSFDELVQNDGVGQTILAGEIKEYLPAWGTPGNWRDLTLGINKSPRGFGGPFKGGARMLFADGRVHAVSDEIEPDILKALSTPKGGEEIHPADY